MAWQIWVAIWAVLVIGAALVLVPLGLSLARQIHEVGREISIATERFAQINDQLERLEQLQAGMASSSAGTAEAAVFDDVNRLRRERARAVRRAKAMTQMRIRSRKDLGPGVPGKQAG